MANLQNRFPSKKKLSQVTAESSIPSLPRSKPIHETPTTDQSCSFFFGRLPLEIRQKILGDAFGDCEIHIYFDSKAPRPQHEIEFLGHPGFPPMQEAHTVTAQELNAWRWYSCRRHDREMLAGDPEYKSQRRMDTSCLEGRGECSALPGHCPGGCMVGAMGFLLSCRQGYLEASEVLYTTNTILVSQPALSQLLIRQTLVPNAPIVIDPIQLPRVTSLEMAWGFKLWSRSDKPITVTHNRLRFQQTLQLLPKAFPNLRWLQVVFAKGALGDVRMEPMGMGYTNPDGAERVLLQPLLQAIRSLSKAKHISFALPSNMLFAVRVAARWNKRGRNGGIGGHLKDRQEIHKKFGLWDVEEWYPFGVDEDQQDRAGEGFWISFGPGYY
ncbi:hypothetical protein QBC34DRAFT_406501 [Podospora aff. communis PSN243]|uniref:DUF7730 domain-containing protein n=1 Tax=Podospora aff. communis PSN243 TaxID=3040156 RepID=A0AAV9GL98_9PEZI|nr:hypothetical protein QBC34DRAFT_406501 [Podospora aff. communis PSN243]